MASVLVSPDTQNCAKVSPSSREMALDHNGESPESGMTRRVRLGGLAATMVVATASPVHAAGAESASGTGSGIAQLVQTRDGRLSCWGVVITLKHTAFNARILPSQLEIRDAKHNSDLREAMRWAVDKHGKKLTIHWPPGKGDFGSGNAVRVCVERSAFVIGAEPPNDRECWSIGTDPL